MGLHAVPVLLILGTIVFFVAKKIIGIGRGWQRIAVAAAFVILSILFFSYDYINGYLLMRSLCTPAQRIPIIKSTDVDSIFIGEQSIGCGRFCASLLGNYHVPYVEVRHSTVLHGGKFSGQFLRFKLETSNDQRCIDYGEFNLSLPNSLQNQLARNHHLIPDGKCIGIEYSRHVSARYLVSYKQSPFFPTTQVPIGTLETRVTDSDTGEPIFIRRDHGTYKGWFARFLSPVSPHPSFTCDEVGVKTNDDLIFKINQIFNSSE